MINKTSRLTLGTLAGVISSLVLASTSYAANGNQTGQPGGANVNGMSQSNGQMQNSANGSLPYGNQSNTFLQGGVSASFASPRGLTPDERLGGILGGLNTPGVFPDVSLQRTGDNSTGGIPSPHMMVGMQQPEMRNGEIQTRSSFTRGPRRLMSGHVSGELDTPGGFPRLQ